MEKSNHWFQFQTLYPFGANGEKGQHMRLHPDISTKYDEDGIIDDIPKSFETKHDTSSP